MESLIALMMAVVLGYRAKQRGREGLKFGAGVATILFGSSAVLGLWGQAVGVHPALWWVIALFTVVMAWLRLNSAPTANSQVPPARQESEGVVSKPAPAEPAVSARKNTSRNRASESGNKEDLIDGLAWVRQNKGKAALRGVLILWGCSFVVYMLFQLIGGVRTLTAQHVASESQSTGADGSKSAQVANKHSVGGSYLIQAATLTADDIKAATDTSLPSEMPISAWHSQGYGVGKRTRVFLKTDNFGTIKVAEVEQLGVRTTTQQVHDIPKFALGYQASLDKKADIFWFTNFFGAGKSARLFFDGSIDYVELATTNDDMTMRRLDGKLADAMRKASKVKVLHGQGATGEIAFEYDLVEFREAVALAIATLGNTRSTSNAGAPPAIAVSEAKLAPPPQVLTDYRYEPAVSTLQGTLALLEGKLPGGETVSYSALVLANPVTVTGDSSEQTEKGISSLQVGFDSELQAQAQKLVGRKVTVTGWLFHASTGDHFTRVLLNASKIAAQ